MTPYTSDDFVEKGLAAAMAAGQDDTTTQDVNREERDVRTRFRQRKATQKAKDNTGRADLQAFAAALDVAMKRAGLKPSEVARLVWGEMTDSRGYTVPRNRDRISSYLAGQSYPEPENVQKLADVLDIPVEKLASTRPPAPEKSEQPERPEKPARRASGETGNPSELILTALPAKPGRTFLRVQREVSWKLATHIQILLQQAADAELRGSLDEYPDLNPKINLDIGKVVAGTDTE